MAPTKNSKRSAPSAAQASPKKPRVDSKLEGIIATLQSADVNEHCRAMLVAMVSSLSTPQSARHAAQNLGVTMIEETLADARKQFAEAAAVAQAERSTIEGSKDTRVARVNAAQASMQEKVAAQNTAKSTLDQAQEAMKTAEVALATAKESQFQGETPFVALGDEKAALVTVVQEHFRAPMEVGQGPHFNFLEPFTENLGLEESLIKALPSSCVKTKEQRGGFDDLVLAEFEKALLAKIAALEKSIADEAPAVAQRKEVVASADSLLAGKVAGVGAAAAELEALTAVRVEAEAEFAKATEDSVALEPALKAAIATHDSLVSELKNFENGTLANFESLRDKSVDGEAATAGA